MSSRIMLDAGPGENPPPAPEPTDADRTPAEPVERRESIPTSEERDAETPHEQAPDAPAEASEERTLPAEAQQRIDRLTRERYEWERRAKESQAQFDAYQRYVQQQQQPADAKEQVRQEVRQEMAQGDVMARFNQACNDLFLRGEREYGQEMGEARDRLNAVGWGDRPDALAAVTQLPEGHRVYRELARDLDNAARVLSLPPMAMAVELARMAGSSPAAPAAQNGSVPVTRAPEPIRPVGGNSRQTERPLDHPQTTMAEFIRRRDREERRSRISR